MPYTRGLGFTGQGVNPLDGSPLQPGQVLVSGPAYTKRVTVVALGNPASWPRWIERDSMGQPMDNGTIAGGTWAGPQTLPDLTTSAPPGWVWIVALVVLYALASGKRKTAGEWL